MKAETQRRRVFERAGLNETTRLAGLEMPFTVNAAARLYRANDGGDT
jgi:hypothetical protein